MLGLDNNARTGTIIGGLTGEVEDMDEVKIDVNDKDECMICFEKRECKSFPCCNNNYFVCVDCLKNMEKHHEMNCPQCRKQFKLENNNKVETKLKFSCSQTCENILKVLVVGYLAWGIFLYCYNIYYYHENVSNEGTLIIMNTIGGLFPIFFGLVIIESPEIAWILFILSSIVFTITNTIYFINPNLISGNNYWFICWTFIGGFFSLGVGFGTAVVLCIGMIFICIGNMLICIYECLKQRLPCKCVKNCCVCLKDSCLGLCFVPIENNSNDINIVIENNEEISMIHSSDETPPVRQEIQKR